MTVAAAPKRPHTVLDPETVGRLWRRLGSYPKVVAYLKERGVKNPNTGRPYTKSSIARAVRLSTVGRTHQRTEERTRSAFERIMEEEKPKIKTKPRKKTARKRTKKR
jgi:hypothetical protein